MKKLFVIDTNVLLHSPNALTSFEDNIVILPIEVLEELDRFKKDHDEKGRNARMTIRALDALRKKGSLKDGIQLENAGTLQIITNMHFKPEHYAGLPMNSTDNKLITTAYLLQKNNDLPVIFVSKDINARIKADALGIKSEDFESQKINISELYMGWIEKKTRKIPKPDKKGIIWDDENKLLPNQFVMFKETNAPDNCLITKHNAQTGKLYPITNRIEPIFGVSPRNPQQIMAQELLLDPRIELVSLVRRAGTGKTLLAIAAGLYMVIEKKVYDRLLISRPIMPLGKDLGYLPGTKEEKLENWMEPIFDNLDYILSVMRKNSSNGVITMKELIENELIQLEALTYMRGRSIPRQYIIIDEAQNLTPHEIKTVVTRSGGHSKMIITGDPYQIDNPYLDSESNGLTYCVERLKNESLFGHVLLSKSERGKLASVAAKLL
ncbi:PhoH family protein [bacterium]|nr:PhoH family protein [bacterium]